MIHVKILLLAKSVRKMKEAPVNHEYKLVQKIYQLHVHDVNLLYVPKVLYWFLVLSSGDCRAHCGTVNPLSCQEMI